MELSLNSNISITPKPDLFSIDRMSTADYIDFEEKLYETGYFDAIIKNFDYTAITSVVKILDNRDKGKITEEEAKEKLEQLKQIDNRKDLQKYYYRPSINQQYSFNLNGGSSKDAYYASFGLDKNIGNLDANFKRLMATIRNTFTPFKFFSFYSGLSYSQIKTTPNIPIGNASKMAGRDAPYIRLADNEGNPIAIDANYRKSYTDTAGGGKLYNWKFFPLDDYTHTHYNNDQRSVLVSLGANIDILRGLSISLKYQYEWQNIRNDVLYDTASFYVRNLVNKYSEIDPESGLVTHNLPYGGILNNSNSSIGSKNYRGQLNFSRRIKKFTIDAILGAEIRKTKTMSKTNTAYGFDENTLTSVGVNETIGYHSFLGNNTMYIGNSNKFTGLQNNYISYFGNASISYLNKYTLSGSTRKDASNLFGVNINDKWKPFWSAGLAWEISKEKFLKVNWVDYLKFRSTVGVSGNVDQSKSAVTVLGFNSGVYPTNLPAAIISQNANPELGWEKIKTLNIGIDFSIFNNTLAGSAEYYKKYGFNLFGPSPIDPTAGLNDNSIIKNVADMIGNGLDIALNINILNKKVAWKTNILVNFNTDKVTRYYFKRGSAASYLGFNDDITPAEGAPLYSIGGWKYGGLDHETGNPIGYLNGHPSIEYDSISRQKDLNSIVYRGTSAPKWFGSIGNSFSWNNFSMNFNILYQIGHYFRKEVKSYKQLVQGMMMGSEYTERWQKLGDENSTNIPSFQYPIDNTREQFYTNSEIFIDRASIIRFQFINFSYLLKPKHIHNKFKSIQFNFNINNIGILWTANKWHIDPANQNTYKTPKTFSLGLNMKF